MKTSPWAALQAAAVMMCAFAPANSFGQAIPSIPVGDLSAFPTIVQTGTKPTLTWSILYPSALTGSATNGSNGNGGNSGTVTDLVTVNPPGTLIPNDTLYVSVQPVGTGVTACDPFQKTTSPFAEARVSLNGSSYTQLFYGTQDDVNPSKRLYVKKVYANQTIDFGGRYVKNNAWTPFYTTRSSNLQVIALVNGDSIPTYFPIYQSSQLASYLAPYLDAGGKVKIGPLSVLILMELGQTNHGMQCFDYQDMVLLVTFSNKHPNNGHGNNLDGVDSSNPGNGVGGPTGANNSGQDPSGGIDDENR